MNSDELCRKAFEVKASHSYDLTRREDGYYANRDTQCLWQGWQAAWHTRPVSANAEDVPARKEGDQKRAQSAATSSQQPDDFTPNTGHGEPCYELCMRTFEMWAEREGLDVERLNRKDESDDRTYSNLPYTQLAYDAFEAAWKHQSSIIAVLEDALKRIEKEYPYTHPVPVAQFALYRVAEWRKR